MRRLTLAEARIETAMVCDGGTSPTASVVPMRINESQKRIMECGKAFPSTIRKYRFNCQSGIVVLPSHLETPLAVIPEDSQPRRIRNQLFEALDGGMGMQTPSRGNSLVCIKQGVSCTYYDVSGFRQIQVIPRSQEAKQASLMFSGIGGIPNTMKLTAPFSVPPAFSSSTATVDNSNQVVVGDQVGITNCGTFKVISIPSPTTLLLQNVKSMNVTTAPIGAVIYGPCEQAPVRSGTNNSQNGEHIPIDINNAGLSKNFFSGINQVIKPETNDIVYVYAFDPIFNRRTLISVFLPNETLPIYTQFLIPGLKGHTGTCLVIAKSRHVPVVQDTDELIITNIAALKSMIMAIEAQKNNDEQKYEYWSKKAMQEMEMENSGDNTGQKPALGWAADDNVMGLDQCMSNPWGYP